MPELPEIETVKLQLEKVLPGQTLKDVEIRSVKTVRGNTRSLVGKKVVSIKRMGKVLLINFGPNLDLGFHFTNSTLFTPLNALSPVTNFDILFNAIA